MTIDSALILAYITNRQVEEMGPWLYFINEAAHSFGVSTLSRMAAFLAQIVHESAGFSRLEENLNYSADGLVKTWPKRFTLETAKKYARWPAGIANRVYADRMGNGNEDSGDGWRYRGRGLIQITGRSLYTECGLALGLPLLDQPDLLLQHKQAAMSAGWYWDARGCNELADKDDFIGITKRINGGMIGLAERTELWGKAKRALTGSPGGY